MTTRFDIETLTLDDAHELAPLVAAYVQDMKRGEPRRPDHYYAETLLSDRTAEIVGARLDGRLVGFAVFFDLPDSMTGMRIGQLDDIYVDHDFRHRGIAKALVETLARKGRERDWVTLRWMVPARAPSRQSLVEAIATPAPFALFQIAIDRSRGS